MTGKCKPKSNGAMSRQAHQQLMSPKADGADFTEAEMDGCSREGCIVAWSESEANEAIQNRAQFASLAPGNPIIGGLNRMPSWYAGQSPSTTGGYLHNTRKAAGVVIFIDHTGYQPSPKAS